MTILFRKFHSINIVYLFTMPYHSDIIIHNHTNSIIRTGDKYHG